MKVHPVPKKRNINPNLVSRQKKLRRLPHIFSKVLELPFPSDADVEVEEAPTAFKFTAAAHDLGDGVGAHAIEIYPGVLKVVVRDESGDHHWEEEEEEEEMEMDRWRFRLPSGARPRLATAKCVDGELVVTVPKGAEDEDEEGREEFGVGHLVLVQ